MAGVIGAAIGRRIRYLPINDDEASFGSDAYAEAVIDIWRAIRQGRVATVTGEVQRIIGRAPLSFEQWVAENVKAFAAPGKPRGRRARS
jgi:hypothetical protein